MPQGSFRATIPRMIGIIDYGMGNLRSVQKAFESLDVEARILNNPQQLDDVDRLILPGVGAFADGMQNLHQQGWVAPLKAYIQSGRPLLGICLGMQLLFDSSEEDAVSPEQPVPGLSILPGEVVRFVTPAPSGEAIKVPHMGWNQIHWTRQDPLLTDLPAGSDVYFVHSYYVKPGDASLTTATCDYGQNFCATIWRDNVWATQYHPEKSQRVGLRMLRNFARLCGSEVNASTR
mgnify:CR=1 FL=1